MLFWQQVVQTQILKEMIFDFEFFFFCRSYIVISLPHRCEISSDERDDKDRNQREWDQIEQSRLSRIHQEEADERGDQSQSVSWKEEIKMYH